MITFVARAVAAVRLEDLNAFVVIVAEGEDGSGERIEIQRALSFDEQDRQLRMDTYCLCGANGATSYGGLRRCAVDERQLSLELTAEAAQELGLDASIAVRLEVDNASVEVLRRGLYTAFEGLRDPPVCMGVVQ